MATAAVSPGRLRRRLVVAFVLVAGVSAGVLAVGSYLLLRQARLDGSVQQAAADTRYELVLAAQFVPLTDAHRADLLTSFAAGGRQVLLLDGDGPAAAPGPTPGTTVRSAVAAGQLGYERRRDHGRQLLLVGGRIPGSTAQLYSVTVEDGILADLRQLRTALGAGWAAAVLLAAAVGHTLARRTLEPVGRASRAARDVAEGLLDTRLPVRGRDEFADWAAAFNEMAQALQAKIEALSRAQARERRFTADVAHELRTPVTALAVAASLLDEHLDVLPDDARSGARVLVADVVRLRRLVEELMEVSRLDAGGEPVRPQPVDVPALLHAIVDVRGWSDRVTVVGAGRRFVAHTDPRRLERVLANLVGNAVEHSTGERRATVRRAGETLVVTVTDQGPGIPAAHLPHLFDRFYKADPARSGPGSGLGLAIARENARLLGARLTVRSQVGVGTEFRLDLPVDPDGGAR
ncbi:sensor histidine kinase [Micromonospora mirobrigensis]|uniref:Signal transduction histidine-protein kinase/phosphatase MprB n=1 Tax=Micromonospora mirobrigensis TaxID=262898 RepID=A0A1C4WD45_9ACTN|nr:HAMP domain-containing sensor histidine kinase [Micromonospora mirobrigensis]SCE94112.1 two-component system, OmpR family, sensor histidine kinase MtrB [Micromonospora mirobrigensis]